MDIWREFHGPNAAYILELYDRYQQDPQAVDASTREFFQKWTPPADGRLLELPTDKIVGAVNLAQAIREYGHLAARLDPLGSPPPGDPSLEMEFHGLQADDLRRLPASLIGGPIAEQAGNALEAIEALRRIYAGSTGYDYDHLHDPDEREWLRQAAEGRRFAPPDEPIHGAGLLQRLTQVEMFEQFLHRTFPGKTRFSIEGLDILVPMLDEILCAAAGANTQAILLGMAHRGRLNVLAHILNKPYEEILAQFKDPTQRRMSIMSDDIWDDLGWTGDVKYHQGAYRTLHEDHTFNIEVTIAPNPSHLESVIPVIEGMARAAGTQTDQAGRPQFDRSITLPVLIHGDAAFCGQGVVAETLNLAALSGYHTGGTIHIIANNQLGYTTTPPAGRSTLYASDLAKGFKIPIVHVNADDAAACLIAARLAFAYLDQFHQDFLIDLIGYRRYGHNEGDEPAFTQPRLYQKIESHPTVREQWIETLLDRDEIERDDADQLVEEQMERLKDIYQALEPEESLVEPIPEPPPPGAARQVETAVPLEQLAELNRARLQYPEDFTPHRKIDRALDRYRDIFEEPDEPAIDWATAESLALASILADGIPIRMTGQDVERGTFSQRHAVLHDVETGHRYIPLQALPGAKAAFEIHNSPLTEGAALAFEYGYNIQQPERLVIWEAQYGDFVNGAQVVIDEFITSARAKWGQTPSLVLLLPHGYEGQGPEHSNARLERFLQLAADNNIRVVNCTTAAQYFHLLRRQAAMLLSDPRPLILMTPKSLLRSPHAASSLEELTDEKFHPVLPPVAGSDQMGDITRLVLCSGKVYMDLVHSEEIGPVPPTMAVARVEELYPFPVTELEFIIRTYRNLHEIVWLQEEPRNMGAWSFMEPRLRDLAGRIAAHGSPTIELRYCGRPESASTAEGTLSQHQQEQQRLLREVFRK